MKKVYVVFETFDNGECAETSYTLISVHETEDGANRKKEALDKGLSSFMRDWGYSYCVQQHTLEA